MKITRECLPKTIKQDPNISWVCSTTRSKIQIQDFEIHLMEDFLENSDQHLKKTESELKIFPSQKEILKEQILLKIKFLKNQIQLFHIQTDNQLKDNLETIEHVLTQRQRELSAKVKK